MVVVLFLMIGVANGDTFVFVDLSKGMSKKEFNELGRLTLPEKKQDETIYKNGEKVYLYGFKGTRTLKGSFVYYASNINTKGYEQATTMYATFFSKVKKLKKRVKKEKIDANVVFVVDTSGSMVSSRHDYLASVKEAMGELIKNKAKKAKISIVTFDGKDSMKSTQRSRVVIANETSKKRLLDAIEQIRVSKNDTFLGSGLQKAEGLLPKRSKRKNVVMIFTDGAEVNDYDLALRKVQTLKKNGVAVKVVAVGGADVAMLQKFSSSGYVFNATKADLQGIIKDVSVSTDEIVLRLDDFLSMASPKAGDRFLIYSSMENIDNISDFSLVPNVSSKQFYKEFSEQNKQRGIAIDFGASQVYVRVIGDVTPSQGKKLKIFWEQFMKDHNAKLRYFSKSPLQQSEVK